MAPADGDVESVVSVPRDESGQEKHPGKENGSRVYASGDESRTNSLLSMLEVLEKRVGVELRGCQPVPWEKRTVGEYLNVFTLWFSMSCNLLP
jgi:hypothetical protein